MKSTYLIITSIANDQHPVLRTFAEETVKRDIPFIVIGDTKSPPTFDLAGCDFYSVEKQQTLDFQLAELLPLKHYARKNIGYLIANAAGAETIIETDDDNVPQDDFWLTRKKEQNAHFLSDKNWVNVYKYFTNTHIWPRGFALEEIQKNLPVLENLKSISCPIQQGLADDNPDVDAIYRLTLPLPLKFDKHNAIALGNKSVCPFNSQNTTWFREAFPLMYLPSYCSFRMTDIWRSFVAQRIAWTCNWPILFHQSTVRQERNEHNLMIDFQEEISGYSNNLEIINSLSELNLKEGANHISENMVLCYTKLIELGLIDAKELTLLDAWLIDITAKN
ncbi:STELLO glycosyltransferase family protein [Pedobacter xixiisoli]|uniref:DUF288 domain-containing protein n=1 Tax=Pedobacter xixiisoli TaxID=1476464 RepID=A0A285ZZB2_9SPHI|nr:STELLO glycosyltransferase family protein [Pedobacter xixiisoli]SOD14989.1 Protein of unknown function, DUF288 [Pedobacter xixiisoli]